MNKNYIFIIVLLVFISTESYKPQGNTPDTNDADKSQVVYIWPEDTKGIDPSVPESVKPQGKRFYNIHNPSLTIYEPEESNGLAIVICPGGGYNYVASGVEGGPTAHVLNESGITVFVLKYRLPNTEGADYKFPVPLLDALRSIQYMRFHASDYNIDPERIGVMGFSAGGHLAAMAGTLFAKYSTGSDEISKVNPRPDFMCLVYPVISTADSITYGGLMTLVDSTGWDNVKTELSSELNVTENTPPTFLVHAKDDKSVSIQNSLVMYDALQRYGVSSEIKIYSKGGHGFGLGREGTDSVNWLNDFVEWLFKMKFIPD